MNFKSFSKRLLNGKSGQGATEYILLLVVVVALVLLFKGNITTALSGKMSDLTNGMGQIKIEGN